MRRIWQLLLLAHTVCAITGPRSENDFDRRRQPALTHPGFNEHQTRFGINSPLQSFNAQPSQINNQQQFQQPFFSQPQSQNFVPQLNNLVSTPSLPSVNIQSSLPLPTNNFQFNQPSNLQPSLPNNFQLQQQNQNHFPKSVPTLASFPAIPLAQNPPPFVAQRPTQAAFLPTLPTQQNRFNQPNAITIQQAPNLGPQNLNVQNGPQIPFQQNLGQGPLFSNTHSSQIQSLYDQQSENLEKLKELQERQRIIQKHQEFVQKQQQKQQEKVEKLHEEFVSKQASKTIPTYSTTERPDDFLRQEKRRPILAHETDLFRKAVELYEKEHPTTTTTTTTTTTPTTTTRFTSRPKPRTRGPPQDKNKQKLYNEIKSLLEESETKGFDDSLREKSVALLQKPDILKQLKVALAENPEDFSGKNFSSREISLNGQKFEIIRTTNPNLIPKGAITAEGVNLAEIMAAASVSPPVHKKEGRLSFAELTKDVLPPGADFELIKQSDNGKLEEVQLPNALQNKKKVTFVFLEEQDDGSFKVKGVKANGQQTEEGPEVENILKKIRSGEIQLPGGAKLSNGIVSSTTAIPVSTDYIAESSHQPSVSYSNHISSHGSTGHTNSGSHTTPTLVTFGPSTRITQPSTYTFAPSHFSTTEKFVSQSTSAPFLPSISTQAQPTRNFFPSSTPRTVSSTSAFRPTVEDVVVIGSSATPPREDQPSIGLVEILKENGLFATAKYLKQSGLDAILNETGPYTLFAPTDKAFRTLLVQLGGPDRAEEKFRDNPRLLSGLLLHHVIPGAFDIASLQDEMTGVSLAGTQLRVNQYDMHDVEWNEVRVTTINGARVLEEKKDIHIPQGIAHAVDRVMFPLPVGDVVQTLQADRDRRFTTFIKAIQASGLADTLAESKTYTIFAPTDSAFNRLPPAEITQLEETAGARALVARHVMPGTLYSAGMRYYQLRDSMEDAKPLTLQKNSGRIKVNNAQVITHNIPATNGVIHAIDTIL